MAYDPNSNQPNRNIDGFFQPSGRSSRQPRERPGIDSVQKAGQQPRDGQQPRPSQPREQAWQPRHTHPDSEPRSQQMSDFFYNFPSEDESDSMSHTQTPAHASAVGPATPAPLGRRARAEEEEQHARWWHWLPKPSWRWLKRGSLLALAVLCIIGGYLFVKLLIAGSQIFQGNIFNAIFAQSQRLEADAHGQTNILLFGTSEDDKNHPGAYLTDSMMVISVDQEKNTAFIVSIPRDLYVKYGRPCPAGYQGKINALYICAKQRTGSEMAAQRELRQKIGEVLGMNIQYSAHVSYDALKQVVNALGGITVIIDSPDPRGVLDRNFDWKCNYECYLVKYDNGPAHLNGKEALYLARARGASNPSYGFIGGNFTRETYQRKILLAIKEKAISTGTLTNPVKVNNLIDALSDNVRTNFKLSELKTLVELARTVQPRNIRTLSLVKPGHMLVTTGSIGAASIVKPTAGLYNYQEIHEAIDAFSSGNAAYFEFATVVVLNASDRVGAAGRRADKLRGEGLEVLRVGNAPPSLDTGPLTLYALPTPDKNPRTREKLERLLDVEAVKEIPQGITVNSDFVIIIGEKTHGKP